MDLVKVVSRLLLRGIALALLFGTAPGARAALPDFDKALLGLSASFDKMTVARGQTVTLKIQMELAPGFHTYPTRQSDAKAASLVNKFQFPPSDDVIFVGELTDPSYNSLPDFKAGIAELHTIENKAEWRQTVVISPKSTPGQKKIKVVVAQLLVCDESNCFPPHQRELIATLNVSEADPAPVDEKFREQVDIALKNPAAPTQRQPEKDPPPGEVAKAPTNPAKKPEDSAPGAGSAKTETPAANGNEAGLLNYATTEDYRKSLDELVPRLQRDDKSPTDLLAFILQGAFWGLVSLVTPCVFPMIPITVSFFLKQSDKQHYRPLVMASVYCGTIVVVLALAALLLLNTFRVLSINPILNFAMGGLFIFFALSLFGMYEIELPSGLARFTSSQEGKGGLVGTIFMALTFTILSFACVAPFLGGFGGTANTGRLAWWEQGLGALAFSITFAAPFFVLALFPSLLKKLPKSGTWLNSVKVVMGFLELAAAFKFLRLGEIVIHPPTIFTYDIVLALWVALCLLCGLYLLSVYRLPHDTPVEHIGVARLLFATLFLGAGFYLLPALFKFSTDGEGQRPSGVLYAWVDSFILPDAPPAHAKGELPWQGNLRQAVDELVELRKRTGQRRFIFIDTTGETCVNCKINERSVFSKPQFKDLFSRYKLVKFYTDTIPADFYAPALRATLSDSNRQQDDAEVNLLFQKKAFDNEQLPLYVILEPLADGSIKLVGQWDEGKINNEKGFAQFLTDPFGPAAN